MNTAIQNCLFGIKYTVRKAPGLYFLSLFTSVIYAVVSRLVWQYIGDIINVILEMLSSDVVDMREIISLLLLFLLLSLVSGLTYNVYSNISNVLLPSRMDIELQHDIVEITDKIPLNRFDLPDFCNSYTEATSAIGGMNGYISKNIFILQSAVSLVVTGVLLYQSSAALLILFILSGIVALSY